jgi:hypothetical protein
VGAMELRFAGFLRGQASAAPALMDFHIAFWLTSIVALVALADCLLLNPQAGAEVSGRR